MVRDGVRQAMAWLHGWTGLLLGYVLFVIALLDTTVDDKLVFDIVGPAFQTIVGGFIGLITGIHIGKAQQDEEGHRDADEGFNGPARGENGDGDH